MEPWSKKLAGRIPSPVGTTPPQTDYSIPCTNSIIKYSNNPDERKERGLGRVGAVYVGVKEPGDFITNNVGQDKLLASGVGYIHISSCLKRAF